MLQLSQKSGSCIDSLHAHIAWVLDLERLSGLRITFPIVADLDQRVSQAYGMIHDAAYDPATVRGVFLIDPKGVIRALLYYPAQLGRNVDEIIRMLEALQLVDTTGADCPVNWRAGDPVVVPAPATQADAQKRAAATDGMDVKSWYLATKAQLAR